MKYIYEFIGTFFLILTIGMTVSNPAIALLAPLAIGSVLAVMVFAGGFVSGAHYNPAVSLAILIRGKLSGKDLVLYWIVQFIAAAVAAFFVILLKGEMQQTPVNLDSLRAFIAEFLFTFALCYVALNVTLIAKGLPVNSYFGWAIGFTVLAGAYAVGTISGGAFNPAVALALCIMNLVEWSSLWVIIAANLLASLAAGFLFRATLKELNIQE